MSMKKITRITEVKAISAFLSESDLWFDCGKLGNFGSTHVAIKYNHPQFWSSLDLFPYTLNYFLGDISIQWRPNQEFSVYLPEDSNKEELWKRAVANQYDIEKWSQLCYDAELIRYSSHLGIEECTYEKYLETSHEADMLWEKLQQAGVVIEDDTLVQP